MALFFLTPIVVVIWYSFGSKPDLYRTHSNDVLSLDRYGEVLSGAFLQTFVNTLQIAAIGTLFCVVIAVPFCYWLAVKVAPRWRYAVLALVLVPYWTNFLIRTIGWQVLLAPEGPITQVLRQLGLVDPAFSMLYTRGAVQLGVIYNYLPLMILPIFVAMERLSPALREASKDLGAGRWATFRQVTLPLARPGIVSGMLLVFIPLMGDYITAQVLGGAKGNMVGQMIAGQFQQGQNWALGSAMSVVLILSTMLSIALVAAAGVAAGAILRRRNRVATVAPEPQAAPMRKEVPA
ncbi:ABC transporter permease [Leucobacter sp. CSA1]|uniref:ABC transporter permease n=2 Tax=Leucobacter chromiisoli TaxID=2796471 RepID=A0A934Q8N0_9MICO|nr:ABC transporter permease [Leucobacter chromiisoli]